MPRSLTIVVVSLAGLLSLAPLSSVQAHGKPEHGGTFHEVEEYTFELLANRADKNTVKFKLYIKDPALKPVTAGEVTLQVRLGPDRFLPVQLKPGEADAFEGSATLAQSGRYRVTALFTRPGQKVLKSRFSIKLI